ncbi:M23 family metallopeptidase [Salirhabdus salicampi]|uniref:M23 family metallopeptidase n=1 Tax=Salirhabdus salicampi TaxID=476102 RepID=UPI0020C4BFA7|nr:M23 family metallopeptidase [Salirhabdus salicampi]MCP8617189.1 peptidoglycan DD-metalloendopeptidase family protein [Salirhabdus salicampi]
MIKKKNRKKRTKNWTILIMSDANEKVRQVNIRKSLFKSTLSISVLFLIAFIVFFAFSQSAIQKLKEKNEILLSSIEEKSSELQSANEQIHYFEKKAELIDVKVQHLDQIEQQLKEMIAAIQPEQIEATSSAGPSGGIEFTSIDEISLKEDVNRLEKDRALELKYSELIDTIPSLIERFETTLEHFSSVREKLARTPIEWPSSSYRVTSNFGNRVDPFTFQKAVHSGIDIGGGYGTPIYATADGTVTFAGRNGGYGNFVEIKHSSVFSTRYAHMANLHVEEGEKVEVGDQIGTMGSTGRSTGVHLHYEIFKNGRAVDPYPYMTFISRVLTE